MYTITSYLFFSRKSLFYGSSLFETYIRPFIPSHGYSGIRINNFNLPPVRSEQERDFTIFRAIELFNRTPNILKEPMLDFKFKKLLRNTVLIKIAVNEFSSCDSLDILLLYNYYILVYIFIFKTQDFISKFHKCLETCR